ncbi:MAG: hypothetical protein NTW52_06810 [Planctomycetota bacterium]|nr:hypothetical protein [Planctomycetota bacterium]
MRITALQTAKRLVPVSKSLSLGCLASVALSLVVGSAILSCCGVASAMDPRHGTASQPVRIDWTTMPSTFTHDPQGTRVAQFSQGVQPVVYERPDYQRSGFRHYRSSLQGGSSADHMHIVDQWGPSVRPYGEWRFPTRPFSVPYPAWGPQLPLTSVHSNFNNQVQFPGGGLPARPWQPGQPGQAWGHGGNQGGGEAPGGWPNWQSGNGQGVGPGNGMGSGGFHPGMNGYQPYGGGPHGFGQFGGVGPYGVGPGNALRQDQDEYYQDAPEPPQLPDREFFFSPAR